MTKIYKVTITSYDSTGEIDNEATWTFLDVNKQQAFLDYLDTLAISDQYYITADEYIESDLEKAKQEAKSFLGI